MIKTPIDNLVDLLTVEDILIELEDIKRYKYSIFSEQFFNGLDQRGCVDHRFKDDIYSLVFYEAEFDIHTGYNEIICRKIERRYEVCRKKYVLCIQMDPEYIEKNKLYENGILGGQISKIIISDDELMEVVYRIKRYLKDDFTDIYLNDETNEYTIRFNAYTYNKIK